MSSSENALNGEQRRYLLDLARQSIRHGLDHGAPISVDLSELPPELTVKRATFVTLEKLGRLRGCIGMLEAARPLAEDIAQNAYAAAFRDPRFQPLERGEFDALEIHLSLLTPPEPMSFESETDLLAQLRPGVDGLILEDGRRRATFLPSVWEQLPDSAQFLAHLKRKAGWSQDYWSATLRAWRYRAESVSA
jgi:AmmeMemoRadiSam system protein A